MKACGCNVLFVGKHNLLFICAAYFLIICSGRVRKMKKGIMLENNFHKKGDLKGMRVKGRTWLRESVARAEESETRLCCEVEAEGGRTG